MKWEKAQKTMEGLAQTDNEYDMKSLINIISVSQICFFLISCEPASGGRTITPVAVGIGEDKVP